MRAEALLLGALALALASNRLTGSFAYEFSFILGIFAALVLAGGTALRLARTARERPLLPGDFHRAMFASQTALLLPLGIGLVSSRVHPTCRYGVSFAWFLLLPAVSAAFGAACGAWANRKPASPARAFLRAYVPILLFSLLTLRDLALDPPLFFLNPAFGYFAGPIYDEWIPITREVVSFRIWTLLLAGALVGVAVERCTCRSRLVLLLILSPLLIRPSFGWFFPASEIRAELSSTAAHGLIRLHHAGDEAKADLFARNLSFRAARVSEALELGAVKPVDVYLYPSPDVKRRLTGTRYTVIGNPMQRALHLLDTDPADGVLTHELTHVLAAPLGIPPFGMPKSVALLEGLATAMEKSRDGLSLHEWAAGLRSFGRLPDLTSILGPAGFYRAAASRAYLASGSFVRWLIDAKGIDRFRYLYRGSPFHAAYGRSLASLVAEWEAFLRVVPLSPYALTKVANILAERPIFERRCPHDVADAVERGRRCPATEAPDHFERALGFSGGAPTEKLRLAMALVRVGEQERSESLARDVADGSASPSERNRARLLLADRAARRGDPGAALRELDAVLEPAERMKIEADVRRAFLSNGDLAGVLRFLQEKSKPEELGKLLHLPVTPANAPRILWGAQAALDADRPLIATEMVKKLGKIANLPVTRERLKTEARVRETALDFDGAARAWEALMPLARTMGERIEAAEQAARLRQMPARSPGRGLPD